ncbi:ATP-binding cassette domain-containing protein [Puia sp. P3]|uniref:ATP-binding cassette domain-containing protein n=1 Tax=Puia sp. P3 TaxID=3423952 RepID=UPI003D66AF0A
MPTEILKAERLSKFFYEPGKFQVLHDVSLSVTKGEFLAIMGKSGCGKSTLLYLLSTLDTDYEGDLFIMGKKISGMEEDNLAKFRNENIGFVFQFHYLLPEFSARENVMLPALKLARWDKKTIEKRLWNASDRWEWRNSPQNHPENSQVASSNASLSRGR